MDAQHYDVIIIGSGMGGLACAGILAQLGKKRVLVLEQHSKAGGFTHVFKRETKYEWDVGLHYVGQMHKETTTRAVFDYLTSGKVTWNRLPDPYEIFVYPDLQFAVHAGADKFKQDLITRFPHEKQAIVRYFKDLKKIAGWTSRFALSRGMPAGLSFAFPFWMFKGASLAKITTGDYLARNFEDPWLQAILVSQWGDYGLPPGMSSFVIHAAIVNHYLQGAFYPAGGAKTIADSIIPNIEQAGGQVLLNHQVTEILVHKGKVRGVRAVKSRSGDGSVKEFFAERVVSDAGAWITYGKLLPEIFTHPYIQQVQNFPVITANVTLYVGFKSDPRSVLDIKGENYWIYAGYDHDDLYRRRNEIVDGKVRMAFCSFPSLKKSQVENHTAEIISFVDYEPFKAWADQPLKKRDQDYQQLKARISQALLDFVEGTLPGFKAQVAYHELSTPLSTEYYTGYPQGNIYGIPATPQRYKQKWIGVRTPVKNLYLTGSDAAAHGISGALMGGVLTAATILGMPGSLMKILRTAKSYSRSLPGER
jgi:all-trans-retinol 13,14-reductase